MIVMQYVTQVIKIKMSTIILNDKEIITNNERDCRNYFSIKDLLKSQGGEEFNISFSCINYDCEDSDEYLSDVNIVDAVIQVGDRVEETYIDSKTGVKYTVFKNSLISISTGNEDSNTLLFGNLAIRDTTSAISDSNSTIVTRIVITDDSKYCSIKDFVKLFDTFYEERYKYGSNFADFLFNETDIEKKNSSFICIKFSIGKVYYSPTIFTKTEMFQINMYCNVDKVAHYNLKDDEDDCYIYSLI